MPAKKPSGEIDPASLRKAMLRRLKRRTSAKGEIVWPAVPSLLDHYARRLVSIFASLGRKFTPEEIAELREKLKKQIEPAFRQSPHSEVVIVYFTELPPKTVLTYSVSHRIVTIADEYADWARSRKRPLFGPHPDAKVMEVARSLGDPGKVTVADIGAGTGRNTIPLARAGYAVDAIELAPSLATVLKGELEKAEVNVRVIEGDVLDPTLDPPAGYYSLIILSQVVSHFRGSAQLRSLLELSSRCLSTGGLLLFNIFLANNGYDPTTAAREMSEVMWCRMFTRRELENGAKGLPLTLVSDESTYDYEREHLEASAWPPTGWFSDWTRGNNLFDIADYAKIPFEMRWLVYRRED